MTERIITADGISLEAVVDRTPDATGCIVVCHPHPEHGGTMRHPMLVAIVREANRRGLDAVRFNFRGVGRSEGRWSGGTGEIEDVAAAAGHAGSNHPGLPHVLAGWSFGAHTALRWQARADDARPYAGIAPPVSLTGDSDLPAPVALPPARRLFVVGDRDQFTSAADLCTYAQAAGAACEVLAGSDHFFAFRETQVADLLIAHFAGDE